MATQPKMVTIPERRGSRPWRDDEPVIVGKFLDDKGTPEHRVVPPHKFASAGDTLVFKYYDCKIDIQGDIFEPPDYSIPNEVRATLKKTLPRGIHHYKVFCDGKVEAKGGSPPTVIIDP
ncbi:MAG: hypothetical protein LAN70_00620 [Acidobacteriia bacterium]|nr:hypothetical protein [Terriglobia bacterium]